MILYYLPITVALLFSFSVIWATNSWYNVTLKLFMFTLAVLGLFLWLTELDYIVKV